MNSLPSIQEHRVSAFQHARLKPVEEYVSLLAKENIKVCSGVMQLVRTCAVARKPFTPDYAGCDVSVQVAEVASLGFKETSSMDTVLAQVSQRGYDIVPITMFPAVALHLHLYASKKGLSRIFYPCTSGPKRVTQTNHLWYMRHGRDAEISFVDVWSPQVITPNEWFVFCHISN